MTQHGGKRNGAGRKPGAVGLIQKDGQTIAQQWGPAAIRKAAEMAGLLNAKGELRAEAEEPHGQATSESVRMSALDTIIERAYGKAAQPLNHGDNEGGKLQPVLNILGSGAARAKPPAAPEAGTRVSNGRH